MVTGKFHFTLFCCVAHGRWCGRRDSNPHIFRYWNLNPARLPVPPRPRGGLQGACLLQASGEGQGPQDKQPLLRGGVMLVEGAFPMQDVPSPGQPESPPQPSEPAQPSQPAQPTVPPAEFPSPTP